MARPLTIVMYHYVRDPEDSRFPDIHGLSVDGFRHQLDYVRRFYDVVSMEQVVTACVDGASLPENPILLTFDDGLADHRENVFPILREAGLPAAFFPSSRPVEEERVLDVHKIHFVLAAADDRGGLLAELAAMLSEEEDGDGGDVDARDLLSRYDEGRYDAAGVTAFKRLLQRDLPRKVRERVTDRLFRTHVTRDEASFARELYMSGEQIREMRDAGMYFGCHGHAHLWLDSVPPDERREELDRSLAFLDRVGAPTDRWVMCYPYGARSPGLVEEVRRRGCAVGLLAEPGVADLEADDRLELPRLDTNDLPQRPADGPNRWTTRAMGAA